jgi:2-polyprenyl-6-methoxyphenol hydroxylase-like FAD-dependent oxidoreductase
VLVENAPLDVDPEWAEVVVTQLAQDFIGNLLGVLAFNWRLTDLIQDSDGVTLRVMTPDRPEEMRARWVIGADGASSTVREKLALEFEGMTWAERFVATKDLKAIRYPRENSPFGPVDDGCCGGFHRRGPTGDAA